MPGKFQTFKNPVFFSGTPKSAEIIQGAVEDCYLVPALSTLTSIERLINSLCVAVSMPLVNSFCFCFCWQVFCSAIIAAMKKLIFMVSCSIAIDTGFYYLHIL